jgi:large subunit ribosomal protein L21
MTEMKAVVELGGKQYLIEPGTIFLAEKVPVEKGSFYTTDRVLMILDGDEIVLGKPYVDGAKVTFTVLDQTKLRKVTIGKFRAKKGYLRTRGHRQEASQLQVEIIEGAGKREERTVDKKRKRGKAVEEPEAEAVEAAAVEEKEPEAVKKEAAKPAKKAPAKAKPVKKAAAKPKTVKKTPSKTKKKETAPRTRKKKEEK